MDPPADLEIISRPYSSGFGLSTLETNIIDYSLSRAEMYFNEDPNAPAEVASSDLDKKQIFDAIGENEDDAFLRDTYRQYVLVFKYLKECYANIYQHAR